MPSMIHQKFARRLVPSRLLLEPIHLHETTTSGLKQSNKQLEFRPIRLLYGLPHRGGA